MDFKDLFRAFLLMEFPDPDRKKYNEACSMLEDGDYQGALDAFCEIAAYEDSAEKADECLYQMGIEAMQAEDWETAAYYFEDLNFDYSEVLLQSCREMLNMKKYNKAYPTLEDRDYLGEFAAFLIKKINEYLYRTGVDAMRKEDWETAVVCFEKLYFNDSEELLQSCREIQNGKKQNGSFPVLVDWDYLNALADDVIKQADKCLYWIGVAAMKAKEWEAAVSCFENLNFDDSEELLQSCREMLMNEKK